MANSNKTSKFISPPKGAIIQSNIKIVFWNTRSFLRRKEEVECLLKTTDIFICVETWLTDKISVQFPGFLTFRKDRCLSRGGGILILIRKSIAYIELIDIFSPDDSVEMCGIHVNNVEPAFDIIVCYRTPGFTLAQNQWDDIVKNVSNRKNCILLGDFNAHNVAWNCLNSDTNGIRFYNAINAYDLLIHNSDSKTHIDFHRNVKSNLDLVLSTSKIAEKMYVTVNDETCGSDHYPIYIDVDTQKYRYIKKSFKLKSIRTDWQQFENCLEKRYNEFFTYNYDQSPASKKYEVFFRCYKERNYKQHSKKICESD